jgi:hypothetical protein
LVVAAGLLVAPGSAGASVFEVFGAGARAQGLAGVGVTTGRDAGAAWLNPATLVDVERSVHVGWFTGFDRTSVLLMDRPAGYDPKTYDTRLRERRDTEGGGSLSGIVGGLTLQIPAWDLSMGAVLYVPSSGFARMTPHFNDEQEQYFSNQLRFDVLGERLRSEVMAAGLGYRLTDWLSLGVGIAVLPINTTDAAVYTPNASDPAGSLIAPDIEQGALKALTAGIVARPMDWLRIGASFQDEVFFRVQGTNEVQLRGTERGEAYPVLQDMNVVGNYSPPRVTGGASVHWQGFTAALEARWRLWGRFKDSFGADHGFQDTVDLSTALEVAPDADTTFRLGGSFRPTPVSDTPGRLTYVDNNRFVLAIGGGRHIRLGEEEFDLDLGIQLQGLIRRTVHKELAGDLPECADGVTAICDEDPRTPGAQIGSPGFPGWTSGGYLLSASLDLRWLF